MDTGGTKAVDLPYDVTGWTLPMQMGVTVLIGFPTRVTYRGEELSGLKPVTAIDLPPGKVDGAGTQFVLSHEANANFHLVNDVLAAGGSAAFVTDSAKTPEGTESGALVVSGVGHDKLAEFTAKYGTSAQAIGKAPAHAIAIHRARVGLYRPWQASIDEGWTRWILEQYGFAPISL